MDFFARQEAARRATRWLLAAFLVSVLLVAAAVAALVYVFAGARDAAGQVAPGPAIAAGVATLLVICAASLYKSLALRAGGGVVARSLGGTRVERSSQDLALRRLHNVVEEMAIASGVSMPEVYVLEAEEGINAFAAGSSSRDAAVAVTRGALTRLNREQLQGVIAHEFSHILNGDMRLNSKLLGWVFGLLVVAIAARMFLHGAGHGSRRRDKGGGGLAMIALIVMVVGYIGVFVGRILQAAVSRHRERLADASAVQFTRNPSGLVGALLKIAGVRSGSHLASPDREEVAHMLFAPGMARLFSTHPRLEERLRALDPTLATRNIRGLAEEAAREAEQLRLAPTFEDLAMHHAVSEAVPMDTSASPALVSRLAGTFDQAQVDYAHDARLALPETLRTAADSADAARVLLFALLRSADETVAGRQDEVIRSRYGEALRIRIHETLPAVRTLPDELRLPAVQQLLPALRRMTPQERQELQAVAQSFALADERIDVFECCLTLLLEAAVHEDLDRADEHGHGLIRQFADAARVLFAVLAAQGARDLDSARSAYDAGISRVLPAGPAFTPVPHWPAALQESLRDLVKLRPAEKKTLVEGLVCTIAHDRRLAVAEAELLRTVCALLHCPLPPILSGRPAL